MENYIIAGVAVAAIVGGVVYSVKHFKGKSGCCGGGDYKPKKKRLSGVKYKKSFSVGGMHCKHCKYRVEEAVNDIKGISAKVNLKKSILTVSYTEDVSDEIIKARLEKLGYSIKN